MGYLVCVMYTPRSSMIYILTPKRNATLLNCKEMYTSYWGINISNIHTPPPIVDLYAPQFYNHKILVFRCFCHLVVLPLTMRNKLRCHAHFYNFHPIRLLDPGCWYKFTYLITNRADQDQFRSHLICIYNVCKGRAYPGSAGLELKFLFWVSI